MRQLTFAFAAPPKGGGDATSSDESEGRAFLARIAGVKKASESAAGKVGAGKLLERIASEGNLATALLNVARNRGAPGKDGQSVGEVVGASRRLLPALRRALQSGTYRPGDVRRVWIPKPGGGQRGLGIPNVVDRWVQQAVLQVLEPLYEPTFHGSSHGFRRNRGAHTAIAEAKAHVKSGCRIVVDLDLAKFFDRVHHQRLMDRLAQRVKDGRVLVLIRRMLKAKVVLPDGVRLPTEEGVPQGGPLSPLLSNLVLDELDWELARRGLRFVRYADDCNVFVRSLRAGRRVMGSIRRFLERRLRLQVNEEKSAVARPGERHFLGFRLCSGKGGAVSVHMSEKAEKRLRTCIRELTPRSWGQSLAACLKGLNAYLRGWAAHFRSCTEKGAHGFRRFDAHIRRRIRAIAIRHQKRRRTLYRHLQERGASRQAAYRAAYDRQGIWAQSKSTGASQAYPNAWFAKRLVSLFDEWKRLNPAGPALRQTNMFGP